jgi:rod shape-determining protein MreC
VKSKKSTATRFIAIGKRRRALARCFPLFFAIVFPLLIPAALKNNIKSLFASVQIPIHSATASLEKFVNALRMKTISKEDLASFCESLLRENLFLKLQSSASTDEYVRKNGEYAIENFTLRPARVVRRDIATWSNELLIDVGHGNGIAVGMGVISNNCVIGRIKSVGNKMSIVELVTSPQFRMVVHASGDLSMAPIIFTGGMKNSFTMEDGNAENVPAEMAQNCEKILLVTSSLSGFFPENIAVGTINPPKKISGNDFSASVVLDHTLLSRIYEVAVLIPIQDEK